MRCLLICITVCLIWSGGPHVLAAENVQPISYVVHGNEKFSATNHPGVLSSLDVPKDTSLTILSDVTLVFSEGALFSVEGTLRIAGTALHPTVLKSSVGFWRGIYDSSGMSSYSWVTLQSASAPIIITKGESQFQHVRLIDNKENTIVLGQIGSTYDGVYTLTGITFVNKLLGTSMGNEGIVVQGFGTKMEASGIDFQDNRAGSYPLIGVSIEGPQANTHFQQVSHQRACSLKIQISPQNHVQYIFDPNTCDSNQVPIVFVPGYGTSIHLPTLTSVHPTPTLDGWRFFQGVTPSYTSFITSAKNSGVKVFVAYYDWRMPADEIVKSYLVPFIEKAKQESGSKVVNLVAHSYGGVVSRAYIQSDQYKGDVVSLTELGTPNQGSLKAYPVWEAGVLPSDWQALAALVRWYEYNQASILTDQEVIQKVIPSVQDLLPTYPSVNRLGLLLNSSDLFYQNTLLSQLNSEMETLLDRVRTITYYSDSEPTQETLNVGPLRRQLMWRDGWPADVQPQLQNKGDGTVLAQSVIIPGAENHEIQGLHSNLPGLAVSTVIQDLYPGLTYKPPPTPPPFERISKGMLWFFFDCPVVVNVTMPDGERRSSDQLDSESQVGEVASNQDMTWMLLPAEDGRYGITITALASTEVRFWVNQDPIQSLQLRSSEVANISYDQSSGYGQTASPSPTPVQADVQKSVPPAALPSPEVPLGNNLIQSADISGLGNIPKLVHPFFRFTPDIAFSPWRIYAPPVTKIAPKSDMKPVQQKANWWKVLLVVFLGLISFLRWRTSVQKWFHHLFHLRQPKSRDTST